MRALIAAALLTVGSIPVIVMAPQADAGPPCPPAGPPGPINGLTQECRDCQRAAMWSPAAEAACSGIGTPAAAPPAHQGRNQHCNSLLINANGNNADALYAQCCQDALVAGPPGGGPC